MPVSIAQCFQLNPSSSPSWFESRFSLPSTLQYPAAIVLSDGKTVWVTGEMFFPIKKPGKLFYFFPFSGGRSGSGDAVSSTFFIHPRFGVSTGGPKLPSILLDIFLYIFLFQKPVFVSSAPVRPLPGCPPRGRRRRPLLVGRRESALRQGLRGEDGGRGSRSFVVSREQLGFFFPKNLSILSQYIHQRLLYGYS